MALTPPSLTRSPASPPNTYCASESSLDYPSPVLLGQQYKISSMDGAEPTCSMAQQLDSGTSLPPLESLTQPGWDSTTIMEHSSPSGVMSNVLSAEYDPFANYEPPLPAPYSQDAYPHPPSHAQTVVSRTSSPTASGPEGSARSPAPTSRGPFDFSQSASASVPLAPRLKVETAGGDSDYSPVEMPNYPSPRSVHGPFGAETNPYPAAPSTHRWTRPPQCEVSETTYYPGAPNGPSAAPTYGSDKRGKGGRPRRAPRRLTTKEEANFQCEVKGCGKLFSRSYNFKAHMETHDEKREYPFPCTIGDCDKRFVRKTDLQRHHQSVHMKERNHKCDYCGRLFARKDTLRRHMEDGCSKRFDIGTLDLRAEGYGMDSTMGSHIIRPTSAGALPPMAIPPNADTGRLNTAPPLPMRGRGSASNPSPSLGWAG